MSKELHATVFMLVYLIPLSLEIHGMVYNQCPE